MPVLINFKICDNAKECNGIAACPTGALFWSDEKKSIVFDNGRCAGCGKCVPACMVGAIHLAKTDSEYRKIKKQIDEDKRKASDLFIDRYGAQSIHPAFLIDESRFNEEVLSASKLTMAELFNDDSIMCLLFSVPIKDLVPEADLKYRKLKLSSDSLQKKYHVKKLPSLLFFKDGRLVGKVEGFYGLREKKELIAKIRRIVA